MWKSPEPLAKVVLLHFLKPIEKKLFALVTSSPIFHRGEMPEDAVSSEKMVETILYL